MIAAYLIWVVSNIIDLPFSLTRLQAVKDSDNDRMRFVATPYVFFIIIGALLAPISMPTDFIRMFEYGTSKDIRDKYKSFHNFYYNTVREEYESR